MAVLVNGGTVIENGGEEKVSWCHNVVYKGTLIEVHVKILIKAMRMNP